MAKGNKRKAAQAAAKREAAATPEETRRAFLGKLKVLGIAGVAVAGGGLLGARYFSALAAEHDLTRIGKGAPKVVQVHDPQCPICARLQREARAAVESFEDDEICLLVADISTPKGRRFAATHGVPHITLVLFDGDGEVVEILPGERGREELKARFGALIA